MAVTIQQIADIAGVSRGTVDRALNNRGRINPEVAQRIQNIASELGYVPIKRKTSPSKPQTLRIGIVTLLSQSSFMEQVHQGIADAAKALSYRNVELIVKECTSVDETQQLAAIEALLAESISGLAMMPVDSDSIRAKINHLSETGGMPIITFNADIIGTRRCCFVGLDNRKSGRAAAGLMGMMTRGQGKVLVITGFFSNSVNSLRVDGFLEELKSSYSSLEVASIQCSFDEAAEVERLIINTMQTHPNLTGIFIASSGQAGVHRAFEHLGLKKRPYVIIYDLTPQNIQALNENTVDFLIDQEVYLQGYRPPLLLADILQKKQYPGQEYWYTDIRIMTKYTL